MAADRAKTTLMISLIIFVMISFILAVTTYLGFQQRGKERQSAETARSDMEKANRDRDAKVDEVRRLLEVLGTEGDSADKVEAERNELFDNKYAGFDKDPKSFRRLVEWLDEAVRKKDEQIAKLTEESAAKIKEHADRAAQAEAARDDAQKARDTAVQQQADQQADFQKRWEQHEKSQAEMKAKQDEALAQADLLKAVTEELVKIGPLLSPEVRRKFSAAPAEGQPEPWPERVRFVFRELLERQKTMQELNATLAALRVADPRLQDLVRDATPEDDRIDGFDGRIATINSLDRSVLIVCDSTAGMRPGLVLSVYDPDDPRPQSGARKALVEVVEVEGPTLARARIRRESTSDPILANDGVATSLWAPGTAREVVIVGFAPYASGRGRSDTEGQPDGGPPATDPLLALLERNGARVVDTVTPQTAIVVDTGTPRAGDLRGEQGEREWKLAEGVRRRALERAAQLGIRVVTLDGLLDTLGLDRESLDGRRLPTEVGAAP